MKRLTFLLMAACALPVMGVADLHDPSNAADYMIVTTQQLINEYPWINLLADWRNAYGRTAMVVSTEDIWSEFGTGVPSDTVLKRFLHYARQNWQGPQLKDVFIIGFHDVVPSHVEADSFRMGLPDSIHYQRYDYLSDFFFATDPDSDNHLPVLNIGRLPWTAEGSDELWNYYDKVVLYETAFSAPWQTRVHLIADSSDEGFNFSQGFAEPIAQQVQPGYTIERDYLDYPDGDPWHGDSEEIFANLNAGSYLVEYLGRIGECNDDTCEWNFWSPSMHLDSVYFSAMTNHDHLPIVVGVAFDPHQNDFSLSGVLASLFANPNGGAIGYFGWTVGWASNGVAIKRGLTGLVTSDSVTSLGELWNLTGRRYLQFTGGSWQQPQRQTLQGMMLFGDPGLVIPSASHPSAIELPKSFRFNGNYPNPFNSSTNIEFDLSTAAPVKLSIFNLVGQHVSTLLEAWRIPGHYSISWNAGEFPSGVYYAVLQAGGVRQTIKMMLLK